MNSSLAGKKGRATPESVRRAALIGAAADGALRSEGRALSPLGIVENMATSKSAISSFIAVTTGRSAAESSEFSARGGIKNVSDGYEKSLGVDKSCPCIIEIKQELLVGRSSAHSMGMAM